MAEKNNTFKIVVLVILIIAAAAGGFMGYRYMHKKNASGEADNVLATLKQVIPMLGKETDVSMGDGRDPLPIFEVNGIDIVGCLEIPSIDLMVPVTSKGDSKAGFAAVLSRSPVKGRFGLTGSKKDVFSRLASVKPGDNVAFTDMDGVRYTYSVTTQFHLKKWDKADNDLMLSYKVDDDTRFVVGCKRL
jgi:sortase (surface protein transpeptidase)